MTDLPKKLAICVTSHFNTARLPYLKTLSDHFAKLSQESLVTIITNTSDLKQLAEFRKILKDKGFTFQFLSATNLSHPDLLPWSHFPVFRTQFEDQSISHFLYVEDDILLTDENVMYWVEAREQLRRHELIPSFLRVEHKNDDDRWYVTDITLPHYRSLPHVDVSDDLRFVSFPTPYQGTYLLDRTLMAEHLSGPSSHLDLNAGGWGVREKAAQGLTSSNVPTGFWARNVVPYSLSTRQIDRRCLIHHLPNNYANSTSIHGKVLLDELYDD